MRGMRDAGDGRLSDAVHSYSAGPMPRRHCSHREHIAHRPTATAWNNSAATNDDGTTTRAMARGSDGGWGRAYRDENAEEQGQRRAGATKGGNAEGGDRRRVGGRAE